MVVNMCEYWYELRKPRLDGTDNMWRSWYECAQESPSGVASAVTTPDSTGSPLASTTRHLRALLDAVGGSAAAYAQG